MTPTILSSCLCINHRDTFFDPMKFFLSANYVSVKNTRKNVVISGHNVACVVGDTAETELRFYFYPRDCNQTSIKRL
jgi:hypothetical protein